jgi:hypothetical protein
LGLALQQRNVSYPDSGYGLEKDRSSSVNLDINFQPSVRNQFYGFYSWQGASKSMQGNSGTSPVGANNTCGFVAGTALTTDEAVALCAAQVWVADANWAVDSHERTDVLGLGYQTAIGDVKLALDYVVSSSRTRIDAAFGPNVLTVAQASAAAAGFPDMTLVQNTLSAHLLVPIQKSMSAHLAYRYERGRLTDWHYDGVPIGASAAENNATVMLDAGPQNYRVQTFGIFVQFKL